MNAVRAQVMAVVRSHFRPEFLNRVDDILLFHRLRREEIGAIVEIQLKRLQKLLEERKITLDIDQKALHWLGDKGYDPAYGARPLKRVIQRALQDPLAEMILVRRSQGWRQGAHHGRVRRPHHQRQGVQPRSIGVRGGRALASPCALT